MTSVLWATACLAILAGLAVAAVWAVVNPPWTRPRKNLARRVAGRRMRG